VTKVLKEYIIKGFAMKDERTVEFFQTSVECPIGTKCWWKQSADGVTTRPNDEENNQTGEKPCGGGEKQHGGRRPQRKKADTRTKKPQQFMSWCEVAGCRENFV